MDMSTEQDSIKQNIIDWCREDKIQCVDKSSKDSQFTWLLTIGKIILYKQPHLQDRLYFQFQIKLAEIHRKLVNQTWNIHQRNSMMYHLKKLGVQYDINLDFKFNGDEIEGISLHKIHFNSTISKSEFLEKFLRVQAIRNVILDQLNIEFGIALNRDHTNQDSSNVDTGR